MPEEAQLGFETEGVGIECHTACLEGEVWPVWCFAQKVRDAVFLVSLYQILGESDPDLFVFSVGLCMCYW